MMPQSKKTDGLGQGSETGYSMGPLARRQALDPMPPDEAEALDWVLRKLLAEDPEAETRDLVEDGIDESWFVVDEQGMLRVNPEAPEADKHLSKDEKEPKQYEAPPEDVR